MLPTISGPHEIKENNDPRNNMGPFSKFSLRYVKPTDIFPSYIEMSYSHNGYNCRNQGGRKDVLCKFGY